MALASLIVPLLLGAAVGAIGAMPIVGPTQAFVLKLSLESQFEEAMSTALGAALAEACWASVGFLGFTKAKSRIDWIMPWCRAAAAVVGLVVGTLFVLGKGSDTSAVRAEVLPKSKAPSSGAAAAASRSTRSFFFMGVGFALNPVLLVTHGTAVSVAFGVLSSSGFPVQATTAGAGCYFLGVVLGIYGWYSGVAGWVRRNRHRFKPATLKRVMRATGVVLVGLGLLGLGAEIVHAIGGSSGGGEAAAAAAAAPAAAAS